MIIAKMAFRNVLRQKRRTILTMLAMFGGFALSSFSIGWMDGSYNYIIDQFTRYQLGHIQIHRKGYLDRPTIYDTIGDYPRLRRIIEDVPGVVRTAPRLYAAGLASAGDKSSIARIIGVDPALENAATLFDRKIETGASFSERGENEAIIGTGLARRLGAAPGGEIVLLSQAADGSIANDAYTIAGVIDTGDPAGDLTAVYLTLEEAQELFVLQNAIHEIAVIVDKLGDVRHTAHAVRERIDEPGLAVDPWQEFARSFYNAMMADKAGGWIMLVVIILVVAIGVLNTVLMSVLERTREYGLLRAMGTRPAQIFGLVLSETAIMAAASAAAGAAAGWAINHVLSIHGIPMPFEFTYGGMTFTHAFSEVNTRSFLIPAAVVISSALVVSFFPAVRAAHTAPAAAMRKQ